MYTRIYTAIDPYTYTYTYTYIYIYTFMYVCIYIYVEIYIFTITSTRTCYIYVSRISQYMTTHGTYYLSHARCHISPITYFNFHIHVHIFIDNLLTKGSFAEKLQVTDFHITSRRTQPRDHCVRWHLQLGQCREHCVQLACASMNTAQRSLCPGGTCN